MYLNVLVFYPTFQAFIKIKNGGRSLDIFLAVEIREKISCDTRKELFETNSLIKSKVKNLRKNDYYSATDFASKLARWSSDGK